MSVKPATSPPFPFHLCVSVAIRRKVYVRKLSLEFSLCLPVPRHGSPPISAAKGKRDVGFVCFSLIFASSFALSPPPSMSEMVHTDRESREAEEKEEEEEEEQRGALCVSVSLELCLWKWKRAAAPQFGYLSRFMSVVACM